MGNIQRCFPNKTMKIGKTSPQDQQRFPLLDSAAARLVKNVTHVYVKVDKLDSLYPKFEGPYRVMSRPSRSTVEVKIGVFKSGETHTLTFHWSLCKPAFMREDATEGSRPMLGRKPKDRTSSSDDASNSTDATVEPMLGSPSVSAEFCSTVFSHPNRTIDTTAATDTNKDAREIQTWQTRKT